MIHLVYPCFLCEISFENESTILTHMNDTHGYYIPPRPPGIQPLDEQLSFQERYACPACWFHCETDNMKALRLHIMHIHPYEGYNSASDSDSDHPHNQDQKRVLLDHVLAELDNLCQFLKEILY